MAALEFEEVTQHVGFVKAPTAIGIVRNGKDVALIDSGLDENLVRKVLNRLKDEGSTVRTIVNTHAHADHFGGNAFALTRVDAEVWAPAGEHHFMEAPLLEPHTLFGAHPPSGLTTKWLQAAASPVHKVVGLNGSPVETEMLGLTWRFHPLPGHSVNQVAVEVDGVAFLSDALIPRDTLEKYGIVFAIDPGAQRASVERVASIGAEAYQTYHGGIVDDLKDLADANLAAIDRVRDGILGILAHGPRTAEDCFAMLAAEFGWQLTLAQYHLNFATVRGYLACLEREGLVTPRVVGGHLYWERAD